MKRASIVKLWGLSLVGGIAIALAAGACGTPESADAKLEFESQAASSYTAKDPCTGKGTGCGVDADKDVSCYGQSTKAQCCAAKCTWCQDSKKDSCP